MMTSKNIRSSEMIYIPSRFRSGHNFGCASSKSEIIWYTCVSELFANVYHDMKRKDEKLNLILRLYSYIRYIIGIKWIIVDNTANTNNWCVYSTDTHYFRKKSKRN